jgi:hypothetical protein
MIMGPRRWSGRECQSTKEAVALPCPWKAFDTLYYPALGS